MNPTPSYLVETIYSAQSTEWFTPPEYIKAVHQVLNGIELDPASCAMANQTVQAKRYFTKEEDGLSQEWRGRIFLNPPYGRAGTSRQVGQTELWINKLLHEWRAGHIQAAILLVNASLYKQWFAPLWQFPICFPTGRIAFVSPSGKYGRSPHSSALVYLGPQERQFARVFDAFGPVVKRIQVEREQWPTLWTESEGDPMPS